MKINKNNEWFTSITKMELIKEVARDLGRDYTIKDVKNIYRAIENRVKEYLESQDEITIRLSNGFYISSTIKEPRSYNLYGQKITPIPKKWITARVTRDYNMKRNAEYNAE